MKKIINSVKLGFLTLGLISCSEQSTLNNFIPSNENTNIQQQNTYLKTFNSQFNNKGQSSKLINIRLKKTLTDKEINRIAQKYNGVVKRYIKPINLLTIEVDENINNITSSSSNNDTSIKSVEPVLKVELDPFTIEEFEHNSPQDLGILKTLNDPMLGEQYSFNLLQLEEAWKINSGDPRIKIAILDTGVDLNHPDLKNKIVAGRNISEPNKPPMDDSGHGTHCAGIAAAETNNNEGGIGICNKCSIMPVKILTYGSGTDDVISEGIVWAVDNGANVITMSLGIYRSSKPIEDALKYALDKGVTITASAGNKNQEFDIHLPSTYPGVIEVASTDANDKKSSFSNFGKKISVAAPGTAILSTLPTYSVSSKKPLNYGKLSGTSMASPHVAGLAGLILSQKPNLKPAEVTKIIESTSKDLGDSGWDKIFGNGRIDALSALKSISQTR